ncbi:hypothetical protein [Streptomyces sp. NPDC059883]|uniref:hypothetical protein n=1 Tax=unclassified Streptomyces TaxID=2593676 RepID=UPI003650CD89
MDGTFSLVLFLLFLWGLFSGRLVCVEFTVRVVFVLLGLFLGEGVGVLDLGSSPGVVWVLAEVVLVWVFFADAVGLSFRAVWPEFGLYVWLLLFGLRCVSVSVFWWRWGCCRGCRGGLRCVLLWCLVRRMLCLVLR